LVNPVNGRRHGHRVDRSNPQRDGLANRDDIRQTRVRGCDDGRKFWWADWTKLIGDAITAVRTGEPVLHPEDEDD
jgi:hypothetical protein